MRLALVVAIFLSFCRVAEAASVAVECKVSVRSQAAFAGLLKDSLKVYLKQNFPGTPVSQVKLELQKVTGGPEQKILVEALVKLWGVGANGSLTFKTPNINRCSLDFVAYIQAVVNGVLYRGSIGSFPIAGSYEPVKR